MSSKAATSKAHVELRIFPPERLDGTDKPAKRRHSATVAGGATPASAIVTEPREPAVAPRRTREPTNHPPRSGQVAGRRLGGGCAPHSPERVRALWVRRSFFALAARGLAATRER